MCVCVLRQAQQNCVKKEEGMVKTSPILNC